MAALLHGILEQWALAKLCVVGQESNKGTFAPDRLRHLYSARRPSRALAHILLFFSSPILSDRRLAVYHTGPLSGYIFASKAHIDSRKELIKQQYLLHMSSQYGELR